MSLKELNYVIESNLKPKNKNLFLEFKYKTFQHLSNYRWRKIKQKSDLFFKNLLTRTQLSHNRLECYSMFLIKLIVAVEWMQEKKRHHIQCAWNLKKWYRNEYKQLHEIEAVIYSFFSIL